jgi:FG-GAP-like repeat
VLVAGGTNGFVSFETTQLYEPATGIWSYAANLNTRRFSHTATLLPNGKILAAGGDNDGDIINSAELYGTPVTPAPNQTRYADVNGDGKADALYFDTRRTGGVWVSLSIGNGFTAPQSWMQYQNSTPDQVRYADVNGDGKADALYFDTLRSKSVWVSLSTGSSFSQAFLWQSAF